MIDESNAVVLAAIETLLTSLDNSLTNGTLVSTAVNFTAGSSGTTEIVAAGSNSLYVVAAFIMSDTEIGMTLVSTTGTPVALTGIMPVSSRSGFILPPWRGITGGWTKSASGQNLGLTVSAACDVDGLIVTRDLA